MRRLSEAPLNEVLLRLEELLLDVEHGTADRIGKRIAEFINAVHHPEKKIKHWIDHEIQPARHRSLKALPFCFSANKSEQPIRDDELRGYLESNKEFPILIHSNGIIAYANQKAHFLFKTPYDTYLLSKHVLSLVHPWDRDTVNYRILQGPGPLKINYKAQWALLQDGTDQRFKVHVIVTEIQWEGMPATLVNYHPLEASWYEIKRHELAIDKECDKLAKEVFGFKPDEKQ